MPGYDAAGEAVPATFRSTPTNLHAGTSTPATSEAADAALAEALAAPGDAAVCKLRTAVVIAA